MSSNCSVSWLRYNQGATPGGFAFPTRNSWYPLYRPRRDEGLGEPRPGLEPTTTKSRVRPRLGSPPQPRDPESNALTLTLPGRIRSLVNSEDCNFDLIFCSFLVSLIWFIKIYCRKTYTNILNDHFSTMLAEFLHFSFPVSEMTCRKEKQWPIY